MRQINTVENLNVCLRVLDINSLDNIIDDVVRSYPSDVTLSVCERLHMAKCRYLDEINGDPRLSALLVDRQWSVVATESTAVVSVQGDGMKRFQEWFAGLNTVTDKRSKHLGYLIVANEGLSEPKPSRKIIMRQGHFIGLSESDCDELTVYIATLRGMALVADFDVQKALHLMLIEYAFHNAPQLVDFIKATPKQYSDFGI